MQTRLLASLAALSSLASSACLYTISAYADQSCDGSSLIETFGQYGGDVRCHRLPAGYYADCYIVESISGGDECAHDNKLCLGNEDQGGITVPCTLPGLGRCVDFDGPVRFTQAGTRNIFAINPPGA